MKGLEDLKLADPNASFAQIDPTKLSPELQDTYKNMQSHFTRRTQEASDAIKRATEVAKEADERMRLFAQEKSNLEIKLREAENELSLHKKDDTSDFTKFLESLEKEDDTTNAQYDKVIVELGNEVKALRAELAATKQETTAAITAQAQKSLDILQYERKLIELGEKHTEEFKEKLDKTKLIDFALEHKLADLDRAYDAFTMERSIERKANALAEEKYKQRVEKSGTFSQGFGGVPKIFAREEQAPKTMSAATQNILKEIQLKQK